MPFGATFMLADDRLPFQACFYILMWCLFTGQIHFDNINLDKDYDREKRYRQSKLANVLFCKELAARLQGSKYLLCHNHTNVLRTTHITLHYIWFVATMVHFTSALFMDYQSNNRNNWIFFHKKRTLTLVYPPTSTLQHPLFFESSLKLKKSFQSNCHVVLLLWGVILLVFVGSGVTLYSLHPGVIRTELGRHFFHTLPLWMRMIVMPFMWMNKSPREGAQTTIYCAVEESIAKDSGLYYRWAHSCPDQMSI